MEAAMVNVKEHVEGKQVVRFEFYRTGVLYYRTERGLIFEVPADDVGTGVLKAEDRAMLYMRWIRRQLEANEDGRKECSA